MSISSVEIQGVLNLVTWEKTAYKHIQDLGTTREL